MIIGQDWVFSPAGSTRASRVVFGALAKDLRRTGIDEVFGEGANNHLRWRRCSPKKMPLS